MGVDLEALGIDRATIEQRAVDEVVERILHGEAGGDTPPRLASAVNAKIEAAIAQRVDKVAVEQIEPRIAAMIDNWVFRPTSKYGEPKGEPKTLAEFIEERAQGWLLDEVNYEGKSRNEDRFSSSWSRSGVTRGAYLIEKHIKHKIEAALKPAVDAAHGMVIEAINATIRNQLAEVSEKLKAELVLARRK